MNLRTYLDQSRGMSVTLARLICAAKARSNLRSAQVLLSQWANEKRQVPAEWCPVIEQAASGAVTCEELRPDVDWAYLRGTVAQAQPEAQTH